MSYCLKSFLVEPSSSGAVLCYFDAVSVCCLMGYTSIAQPITVVSDPAARFGLDCSTGAGKLYNVLSAPGLVGTRPGLGRAFLKVAGPLSFFGLPRWRLARSAWYLTFVIWSYLHSITFNLPISVTIVSNLIHYLQQPPDFSSCRRQIAEHGPRR